MNISYEIDNKTSSEIGLLYVYVFSVPFEVFFFTWTSHERTKPSLLYFTLEILAIGQQFLLAFLSLNKTISFFFKLASSVYLSE